MGKKLFFYLVMAAFMLVILEAFAFVAVLLVDRDDFFDHRESVLERLSSQELVEAAQSNADMVLGWRGFGPRTHLEDNCQGVEIEYSYDAAGARVYPGFEAPEARVIIVGDSYTNGDEVGNDSTYPAKLAGLLGVSVANHGVGGYGPAQSVLNFTENVGMYPRAEVVVLGIMYENLYRMMNSYRPVLYITSPGYALKPYMADGKLMAHPGVSSFSSLESFSQVANDAFDTDFWAKPQADFPYLASLLKSMGSHYFIYRKFQKYLRKIGFPEYFLIFEDRDVELNLVSLLNQYAQMARQAGLKPVVVFIPRNRHDTISAGAFIERHREELDGDLVLGDVGQHPGVEWSEFNLQEPEGDNICHPSLYGYQVIADYIAGLLRESGF
jgi:hypothetical protein